MAAFSGLMSNCKGLAHHGNLLSKLPFCPKRFAKRSIYMDFRTKPLARGIPASSISWQHVNRHSSCGASNMGGSYQEWNVEDEYQQEPFWLSLYREAVGATKMAFTFLLEQPSQLKYIEWPSFQSTLKTASLTLVLVTLLIIVLSSTDSALSYLLALLLRRKV